MKKVLFTLALTLAIFTLQAQQTFFTTLSSVATDTRENQIFIQEDGYVLAGIGKKNNAYRLYVVKTDLCGIIQWNNYYDLGFTGPANCYASAQDPDGGMYLTVESSPEAHLVKLTPAGEIAWTQLYSFTEIYQLAYHSSGELVAAGNFENNICINRIDPSTGNVIAYASDISIGAETAYPTAMTITSDNTIILSVSTAFTGYDNPRESSLITFPFSLETHTPTDLPYQAQLVNRCTQEVNDEIFGLAHIAQYATNDNRIWLTKFLPDGTVLMEFEKEFTFGRSIYLYDFLQNNQGQLVALGRGDRTEYSMELMLYCMTTEGDSIWTTFYGIPDETCHSSDLKLATDGGYIVSGFGGMDIVPILIKTSQSGQVAPLGVQNPSTESTISLYPNPANDKITIVSPGITEGRIVITDLSGRTCLEERIYNSKTTLNVKELNSGIYIYRLSTGDQVKCGKVILER